MELGVCCKQTIQTGAIFVLASFSTLNAQRSTLNAQRSTLKKIVILAAKPSISTSKLLREERTAQGGSSLRYLGPNSKGTFYELH